MICDSCMERLKKSDNRTLIYKADFGIVNILEYFQKKPFSAFEKLALEEKVGKAASDHNGQLSGISFRCKETEKRRIFQKRTLIMKTGGI